MQGSSPVNEKTSQGRLTSLPFFVIVLFGFLANCFFPPLGTAQEALSALVFLGVDEEESTAEVLFREVLGASLEEVLSAQGFRVLPVEKLSRDRGGAKDFSGPVIANKARQRGADTAVVGLCGIEGKRLFIRLRVYDTRTEKLVAAAMDYGLAGITGYNLVEDTTDLLVPELRRYLQTRNPHEALRYDGVEDLVLFSPDEGMELAFATGEPFGRIEDGSARAPYIPFSLGTSIDIIKNKLGHYPDVERLDLNEPLNEVLLRPLARRYRSETSLYWNNGQTLGIGLGYRYYPYPDNVFLGADYQFFVQHDFMPGSSPVLHTDLSLSLGAYILGNYKSRFRLACAVGPGVVLTSFTRPDLPVYTDYYIKFLQVFLDLNLRPWTVFLSLQIRNSLGWGQNVFGSGGMDGEIGPPFGLGVRKKW